MANRRKIVFALGLLVFLVGGLLTARAFVGGATETAPTVSVLSAARPIPAGTTGAAAVNEGMIRVRALPASARPPEALTDVAQLAGTITPAPLPEGKILLPEDFPAAKTRLGNLRIPEDKTALAIRLTNVPGVAGFAGAGDRINIYGVTKPTEEAAPAGPSVRLIMQHIEVLNVNGGAVTTLQGQPDGPDLVYLLAVTPAEAERLIYLMTFEQLYFSLVPRDQPPVSSTPGSGPNDSLRLA